MFILLKYIAGEQDSNSSSFEKLTFTDVKELIKALVNETEHEFFLKALIVITDFQSLAELPNSKDLEHSGIKALTICSTNSDLRSHIMNEVTEELVKRKKRKDKAYEQRLKEAEFQNYLKLKEKFEP